MARRRIEKLTKEQETQLATYREKWLRIGLATGPTDRPRAEDAVRRAYVEAKLPPPAQIVWLRSPLEGCVGAAMLRAYAEKRLGAKAGPKAQVWAQVRAQVGAQVWDQVGDQVRAQVGAQVGDQVWDQVRAQVRAQVGDQVWDQVGAQVGAQVRAQVGAQVGDQVRAQVGAQVGAQVWAQVGDQVGAQVRAQVRAQVWAQVWDQVGDQVWRCGYGLHDSNWLAFYEYFDKICGIVECQRLGPLNTLAECAGWWWPFANLALITERPVRLERDDRNRLHSLTGAAIAYSDGWGVHAVHGVRVPADIVERPESITPARIEQERNAEIRRVMIDRYGVSKYLLDSGAKELHRDECGILYRKELPGDEALVMVKVINSSPEPDGSFKPYFLRVHPELRPLFDDNKTGEPQALTARNAVASLSGLRGEDYHPEIET